MSDSPVGSRPLERQQGLCEGSTRAQSESSGMPPAPAPAGLRQSCVLFEPARRSIDKRGKSQNSLTRS
eukprot:3118886-Amphidinium_carterae.1